MKVNPFSIDVLTTHKSFFLLNKLPKNAIDIDVKIQTPNGQEDVDFIDVFSMADGSLLAAWVHPLQKLGLQNLVASVEDNRQIINLYPIERMIDKYNKPIDSDFGVFVFTKSSPIDNADWRCDRGYYGAQRFVQNFATPFITKLEDIIMYESFLSVAGAGHLLYMEVAKNTESANNALNNSLIPTTGRTFQEVLRLVYEWSVLANHPFDSTEEPAIAANNFLTALNLSETEMSEIESLTPMQVAQFLLGSETARVRPNNIQEMTKGVEDILFDRMASSSLSFIVSRNPEIWDLQQVLERELEELEQGIFRFKEYYEIPNYVDLGDTETIMEFSGVISSNQLAYFHNQLRHFANKKKVLNAL